MAGLGFPSARTSRINGGGLGARAGARGKHRAAAWREARVEGAHAVKVVKLKEVGGLRFLVAEQQRVREKQSRRREEGEKVQGRR